MPHMITRVIASYHYNQRNRLTSLDHRTTVGGSAHNEHADYTYDVNDHRIGRTVSGGSNTTDERYIYASTGLSTGGDDQLSVIMDGDGGEKEILFNGEGPDQVLAEDKAGGGVTWNITDHTGTVRKVIDDSGATIWSMDYDAFGNMGNGKGTSEGSVAIPPDPNTAIPPLSPAYSGAMTVSATGFSMQNVYLDDLGMVMGVNESITVTDSGSHWTVTIPDDAIIIRATTGDWDLSRGLAQNDGKYVIITNASGTHTYDYRNYTEEQLGACEPGVSFNCKSARHHPRAVPARKINLYLPAALRNFDSQRARQFFVRDVAANRAAGEKPRTADSADYADKTKILESALILISVYRRLIFYRSCV